MIRNGPLAAFAAASLLILTQTATAFEATGWRAQIAADLPNDFEKVIDARWSQLISLWVTVLDDGSRRDGYAEAVCLYVQSYGAPQGEFVAISVWEHYKMLAGDLEKLGSADCQT